jgi:hypothetical protein
VPGTSPVNVQPTCGFTDPFPTCASACPRVFGDAAGCWRCTCSRQAKRVRCCRLFAVGHRHPDAYCCCCRTRPVMLASVFCWRPSALIAIERRFTNTMNTENGTCDRDMRGGPPARFRQKISRLVASAAAAALVAHWVPRACTAESCSAPKLERQ